MRTLYVSILLLLFFLPSVPAQVGINTDAPNAALEIKATTDDQKNGVIIPKLDEFPTTVTADQDSMMIFITGNGTVTKGYWYYDHGSGWKKIIDGNSSNSLLAYMNPKFPDGMKGMQPVTVNLSLGGYLVPVGKNLYITSAYRNGSLGTLQIMDFSFSVNYTIISNTTASRGFPTFNNPIIVAQNDQVLGDFVINGFIVDAVVEPIYRFNSYNVPANKIFVYFTNNQISSSPIGVVRIDGLDVTNTGTNNSQAGNAEPLSMPLFVDEGQQIVVIGSTSFNGYLIDK